DATVTGVQTCALPISSYLSFQNYPYLFDVPTYPSLLYSQRIVFVAIAHSLTTVPGLPSVRVAPTIHEGGSTKMYGIVLAAMMTKIGRASCRERERTEW